ncbi:hypothetical protein [uncultured Caulobacter sp.]|uniref:hypothetical protein n=1 Tax=uncultured Caulobacter sp. TaxID=158749 RepID=UPI0026289C60|nr:hypothetical protein [uncultured Caulobacter sp.]
MTTVDQPVSRSPLSLRLPSDAWFFPAMTALIWLGVVMGFGGEMLSLSKEGKLVYPLLVHVHAVVFTGWLVVFTAQVWLVRSRRVGLHRRLGVAAAVLAGVMLLLGPATAIYVQIKWFGLPNGDPAFLAISMSDMISFAGLTAAALAWRRDPFVHKRLMLLGTLALADAGFGRWTGMALGPTLGPIVGNGFMGRVLIGDCLSLAALLAPAAYDLVTRGRTATVVTIGTLWAVAWPVLATGLYLNPTWIALAKAFVAHLARG